MELCDCNLRDLIEELDDDSKLKNNDHLSLLSYFFCSNIMKEILEGVNYLHTLKPLQVHRGLKPSNILIKFNQSGKVIRIADFSSVAIHGFNEQSHTGDKGTLKYMAPQAINNLYYNILILCVCVCDPL